MFQHNFPPKKEVEVEVTLASSSGIRRRKIIAFIERKPEWKTLQEGTECSVELVTGPAVASSRDH